MRVETYTLAQLLAMGGLIGATIEYAEVIRRRITARRDAAERDEGADVGMRGLVRALLADEPERLSDASSDGQDMGGRPRPQA